MSGEMLDVSVIVPAYRAEATIARALRSIAAQTQPPREIVVVDDGSPDNTSAAAESCRAELESITLVVVRQENAGAGAARNRAVREATSGYLAFLDADDEWLPEKLERSFDTLRQNNLSLVAHNYTSVAPDGSTALIDCAARFRKAADPYAMLYRKGYLATSTLVTRRALVVNAGGFDETLGNAQDFDLWLAILQDRTVPFSVFDDALTRYHLTDGSITTNTKRRVQCCLKIAHRFAASLKASPGGILRNVWLRTMAVHYEAYNALRAQGDRLGAVSACVGFFPAVITITVRVLMQPAGPRHNYFNDNGSA